MPRRITQQFAAAFFAGTGMKRNTSNNPLFREIRELETKALKAGIIEEYEIKTSAEMREEACLAAFMT